MTLQATITVTKYTNVQDVLHQVQEEEQAFYSYW